MVRYRKRSVEVEAFQWWDGSADVARSIVSWINDNGGTASFLPATWKDGSTGDAIFIATREGRMAAVPGDWVIREPFPSLGRSFYPCKPDIFEATYERAGDD